MFGELLLIEKDGIFLQCFAAALETVNLGFIHLIEVSF